MATKPPPIRVPKQFSGDRETFGYFTDLHTFLRLLWERTGGGTDLIAEVGDNSDALLTLLAMPSQTQALMAEVEMLRDEIAYLHSALARIGALSKRIDEVEQLCLLT